MAAWSLASLAAAVNLVSGFPFLAGATTPKERYHAFSVQAALWPLAGFGGSLVGGVLPGLFAAVLGVSLDGPAPYRYPLLIGSLVYGLVALPALLATREVSAGQVRETAAEAGDVPRGVITLIALVVLFRMSSEMVPRVFSNVYLDAGLHAPPALIGTVFAVGQLLAAPAALSAPFLVKRLGKGRIIVWGFLGGAFSLLTLALVPRWEVAGLGLTGVIAMSSLAGAAFDVFHQEVVLPGWRAVMSGAAAMALGLGSSTVAFGGGYIIAALGYRSLFLIGAGLMTSAALLFWAYFRVPRGELARTPSLDQAD